MVYLITGVGGFIGKNLARKLLNLGENVIGLDIKENEEIINLKNNSNFQFYQVSNDYNLNGLDQYEIDTIIHLARGGVSGADYKSIEMQFKNIIDTIKLFKYATEKKVKNFLFADSSHEYQVDYNNRNELSYCSIYGAAKKSARNFLTVLAHSSNVNLKFFAFTNVYGQGDYSFRSTNVIITNLIKNHYADLIDGNNIHDWVYIDDAVNGIILVAQKGFNNKIYYLGSDKLITFKEIVTKVRDSVAPNAQLNFGAFKSSAYIDYSFFDLSSAQKDLGFKAEISIEKGAKLTLEWLKQIGRI